MGVRGKDLMTLKMFNSRFVRGSEKIRLLITLECMKIVKVILPINYPGAE